MKITRRSAVISSLLAFAGSLVYPQTKDSSRIIVNQTPIGLSIDLNTITYLEVTHGNDKVRLTAAEIWEALKWNGISL